MQTTEKAFRLPKRRSRKTLRTFVVFGLLCLITVDFTSAATYYLDAVNGDDNNAGAAALPWKSINRALVSYAGDPNVNPGDTIVLKSGNYGDWIWGASHNFTNTGDWITYKADEDANVVFNELNWANAGSVKIKLQNLKFICAGYGKNQDAGEYTVVFIDIDHVDMNDCYIRGAGDAEWYGSGMKLTRSGENNICEHITIRNTEIYDCITGFGFSRVDGLTLENCKIHHTSNDLISGADLSNSTIAGCQLYDAGPRYEFYLEDAEDTVTGSFQNGELIVQDNTDARANVIWSTDREGHLVLYLDVVNYSYDDPTGYYAFSYRKLTDVVFSGSGLNDFAHTNQVWRLDRWWKVEIDGTGTPDTFKFQWSRDNGATWTTAAEKIPITGQVQDLWPDYSQYMLRGGFAAATGHEVGDYWRFDTGRFYTVRGQNSAAAMTPSYENQAGHADAIQIYTYPGYNKHSRNVIISKNIIHKDEGQGVFLKQMDNVLIENNLFYGGFTSHPCAVQTNSISGTIRNNTYCLDRQVSDITVYGNVTDWLEGVNYVPTANVIADSKCYTCFQQHISESDNKPGSGDSWTSYWRPVEMTFNVYNNIIAGRLNVASTFGLTLNMYNNIMGIAYGTPLVDPDETNYVYGDFLTLTQKAAIFNDPDKDDYSLKQGALPINFADPQQAPLTDILGNLRDAAPDAGCYEYISPDSNTSAPVLKAIGNQFVNENALLSFSVSATDADDDVIAYSAQNLPAGASFISRVFSWTPTPAQLGCYNVNFIASDGQLQDSETITVTVLSTDKTPPSVTDCSPAADSIEVPLDSLIVLHIVDANRGVDANSVTIKVNNNIVYTGNTNSYTGIYGECWREGTKADYIYTYQPAEAFDYDQIVIVTVNASDLVANAMNEYSYSFKTVASSLSTNRISYSGSYALQAGLDDLTRKIALEEEAVELLVFIESTTTKMGLAKNVTAMKRQITQLSSDLYEITVDFKLENVTPKQLLRLLLKLKSSRPSLQIKGLYAKRHTSDAGLVDAVIRVSELN